MYGESENCKKFPMEPILAANRARMYIEFCEKSKNQQFSIFFNNTNVVLKCIKHEFWGSKTKENIKMKIFSPKDECP